MSHAKMPPGFFTKLSRLSLGEVALVAEAMVLILLAAGAVHGLAFTRLGRIASLDLRGYPASAERRRALAGLVGWAVWVVAKRSPFRSLCFEKGLTAQLMLRRRGVDSTLFYGAKPGVGKVDAHVWVLDCDTPVTGASIAGDYAVLASFPAGREAQAHAYSHSHAHAMPAA